MRPPRKLPVENAAGMMPESMFWSWCSAMAMDHTFMAFPGKSFCSDLLRTCPSPKVAMNVSWGSGRVPGARTLGSRCVRAFVIPGQFWWQVSYGAVMLTVRAMTESDVPAVAAIRVTGWKSAYAGIVPRSFLDDMTVEADIQQLRQHFKGAKEGATNLVAVDPRGRVVGWACLGPLGGGGTSATRGELYALYVQPSLTGSGIGRILLDAVHAHARADGFDLVLLWVLTDNSGARRFYERAGYVADGAVQVDDYDGVSVPEVRYQTAL
ncbi:N-acetyltransferase family protein [Streptomyces sp. NPDC002853]